MENNLYCSELLNRYCGIVGCLIDLYGIVLEGDIWHRNIILDISVEVFLMECQVFVVCVRRVIHSFNVQ